MTSFRAVKFLSGLVEDQSASSIQNEPKVQEDNNEAAGSNENSPSVNSRSDDGNPDPDTDPDALRRILPKLDWLTPEERRTLNEGVDFYCLGGMDRRAAFVEALSGMVCRSGVCRSLLDNTTSPDSWLQI